MMKVTEEAKVKIFSMESMAKMYGKTDEEFGRFCRGYHAGLLTVLGALGLTDTLPAECPDDAQTTYASFCAVYGAYLNAESKPRLDKECEDHKMMYGEEAQAMMLEAEEHLKNYKRANRKKRIIH